MTRWRKSRCANHATKARRANQSRMRGRLGLPRLWTPTIPAQGLIRRHTSGDGEHGRVPKPLTVSPKGLYVVRRNARPPSVVKSPLAVWVANSQRVNGV